MTMPAALWTGQGTTFRELENASRAGDAGLTGKSLKSQIAPAIRRSRPDSGCEVSDAGTLFTTALAEWKTNDDLRVFEQGQMADQSPGGRMWGSAARSCTEKLSAKHCVEGGVRQAVAAMQPTEGGRPQ